MKKPVHSSHLALRFYKHHGWTKEILDRYLEGGEVLDKWADQEVRNYWFLNHEKQSNFDAQALFNNEVSEVVTWKDERLTGQDAIDYMRGLNW